jgi:hypothetical protein
MSEIDIPHEGRIGIQAFLALGKDGLAALGRSLDESGPTLMPIKDRALLVKESMQANLSSREIEGILKAVVFPIQGLQQQMAKSATEIHGMIASFIANELSKSDSDWNQVDLERWNELKTPILTLFQLRAVGIESKTTRLLRSRPSLFLGVQVFSDSRPVFSDDGDTIEASLISNTIRVEYRDGGKREVVHLSLDPRDLQKFQDQITRALAKNETIRRENKKHGIQTLEFDLDTGDE